jgi:hypothetical protein
MSSPSLPLFAESSVPISSVQTEITVAKLTMDGKSVVGLQVTTPTGVAFYFLDPDAAKKVAKVIESVASGIILAPDMLAGGPVSRPALLKGD